MHKFHTTKVILFLLSVLVIDEKTQLIMFYDYIARIFKNIASYYIFEIFYTIYQNFTNN